MKDEKLKGGINDYNNWIANSYRFRDGVESLPKRMHTYLKEKYYEDY